ncbi:MAG: 2-C-methyl-D-erythritol 2,4-cyclodiphosphate synthase [Fibrobacterota bacterium]
MQKHLSPAGEGKLIPDFRTGCGYDVHRIKEGRDLILGGVRIPWDRGLDGHSDADVLLHAVMDALLGAAALGDIGKHFPDTDEKFKGADSLELFRETVRIIGKKGWMINNIDCIVAAQQPKLAPYIKGMRNNIADAAKIAEDRISVKATTTEGLGFTGKKEGMEAYSSVLIYHG